MSYNAEFEALMNATTKEDTERLAKIVFNAVDTNGSGSIDKEECREMITHIFGKDMIPEQIPQCVDAAMASMDLNGDGKVTWEEFLAYSCKKNGCL